MAKPGDEWRVKVQGLFCLEVVFNLSHRVLSDLEIEVLSKGLDFSPTPSFINKVDLKMDFADFSRKMRCKWDFRNDITENFSKNPAFYHKSDGSRCFFAFTY